MRRTNNPQLNVFISLADSYIYLLTSNHYQTKMTRAHRIRYHQPANGKNIEYHTVLLMLKISVINIMIIRDHTGTISC